MAAPRGTADPLNVKESSMRVADVTYIRMQSVESGGVGGAT